MPYVVEIEIELGEFTFVRKENPWTEDHKVWVFNNRWEAEEEAKKVKKALQEKEAERLKIIADTRKEFEKAQAKQNKEVKKMFELAQKQTQAEIVKNKFSVTNIEETMTDLMGALNQAGNVIDDDYTDSDDSPQVTPETSPKHTVVEEAADTGDNTIDSISIVITDISGNDED